MLNATVSLVGVREAGQAINAYIRGKAQQGLEEIWKQLYQETQINLSNNLLNIRTGNLIDSLESNSWVQLSADKLVAQVGTDTHYAVYQHFGYEGEQQVKAHMRTQSFIFGKEVSPFQVAIPDHTRFVSYKGKRYLGIPFDSIARSVGSIIQARINGY